MFTRSLSLAGISYALTALLIFAVFGSIELALRLACAPAIVALTYGAYVELRLLHVALERSRFVPRPPVTQVIEVIRPSTSEAPAESPRTLTLHANGRTQPLTLAPIDSALVRFLDTAISLAGADATRFPTVLDFRDAGIRYAQYRVHMRELDAYVYRHSARTKNALTLSELQEIVKAF